MTKITNEDNMHSIGYKERWKDGKLEYTIGGKEWTLFTDEMLMDKIRELELILIEKENKYNTLKKSAIEEEFKTLLIRGYDLIGSPLAGVSGSTDMACDTWRKRVCELFNLKWYE